MSHYELKILIIHGVEMEKLEFLFRKKKIQIQIMTSKPSAVSSGHHSPFEMG